MLDSGYTEIEARENNYYRLKSAVVYIVTNCFQYMITVMDWGSILTR